MRLFRTPPAIRPRRRSARRSARSAVALVLVGSLLTPVPAVPQQDGGAPDPQPDAQLITDVWDYAAETEKGYDHVLNWMRVLKALGALTDMTAAEAQANADQHLAARWDPVVEELRQLETQDGYEPDQQVVSDVWDYAQETGNGFDHVLRWMRVLNAFGALTGMTAAEAQGYADRGSGWERWVPVAAELAELEAAESEEEESEEEESEEEGASGDQSDEPADPVFTAGAAVSFSIAEDHADGESVGTVDATDANGDTLTYSLSGTHASSFTINSATGEISVASGVQLDFATQATHSVAVGVSDGNDADGNPEATATVDATIAVTIKVTSDEPADPDFFGVALTFFVFEDHADGESVGTVDATDANGDKLTYSLSGPGAAWFALDPATAELSVAPGVQLDFETQASHSVTVGVSDGNDADGNPETTATVDATIAVTIRVIDVEDDELRTARATALPTECGVDDPAGTLHWFESVNASATLIWIEYVDELPSTAIQDYELCGPHGTNDANTAIIVEASRTVSSNPVRVVAFANSSGDRFDAAAVPLKPDTDYWVRLKPNGTVNRGTGTAWTHVRTLPGSTSLPMNCGSQGTQRTTFIESLTATSSSITVGWLDSGDSSLQLCRDGAGTPVTVSDELDENNARGTTTITQLGDAALEPETEYWVKVTGYVGGGGAFYWHPIRTRTATPVAPVFSDGASTTLSIAEGHADGASVGRVGATDGNGDTLTYSLSGTHASSFTINSATGEISVASGVTLVRTTTYMVTVTASDGVAGTSNATIAVTIEVAEAPSGPVAPVLTVSAPTPVNLQLNWTEPTDLGTSTMITDYDVRYFAGAADPNDEDDWITAAEDAGLRDPGTATSTQILGLSPSTAYRVQVRATGDGDPPTGDWSASVSATTPAALASPVVQVDNFGQALHGSNNNVILKTHDYATAFTTGDHSDGYRLANIQLFFQSVSGTRTGHEVRAYLTKALPSATTTVVAELASPELIQTQGGGRTINFTAPPNTVLTASTAYFVVVEATDPDKLPGGQLSMPVARDTGHNVALSGWSIANSGSRRAASSTGAWTAYVAPSPSAPGTAMTTPLPFRVRGVQVNHLVFVSAEAAGDTLTLTYNGELETVPAASAFPVTVNGTDRDVTSVSFLDTQVILTLASPVFAGDMVTVSYDKPENDPLEDSDSRQAESHGPETLTVTVKVTGVEITSFPGTDSIYGAGEAIQVTVTFSEAVNVDLTNGRPSIGLDFRTETGDQGNQTAVYKVGSGTNTLLFEYRVVSGNMTNPSGTMGVKVRGNTLALNSASITTVRAGTAVTELTHDELDHDSDHLVNGGNAAITQMVSNTDKSVTTGQDLLASDVAHRFGTGPNDAGYELSNVVLHMSQDVLASFVRVRIATGLPANTVDFVTLTRPSGTTLTAGKHTFTAPEGTVLEPNTDYWVVVEVTGGTLGTLGLVARGASVKLPGWSLGTNRHTRSASSTGSWTASAGTAIPAISVNGIPAPFEPAIRAVEITSDPGPDDTYGEGANIQVSVTFSRAVVVDTTDGTPRVSLAFSHMSIQTFPTADYVRGSGTKTLVFEYTVTSSDMTDATMKLFGNVVLNSGTIKSVDGLDALVSFVGQDFPADPGWTAARRRAWCWCPTSTRPPRAYRPISHTIKLLRGSPPARTPPGTC